MPRWTLRESDEAAEEHGVGMHIHLSETRGEAEESRARHGGRATHPIELMDSIGLFEFRILAAHCVHVSPKDTEILSAKRGRGRP